MKASTSIKLALPFLLALAGCIRTQNYHPVQSTFPLKYSANDKAYGNCYFANSTAQEAYVELDARGAEFRDRDNRTRQLDAAVDLIKSLRQPDPTKEPNRIAVYVFIHGWKNNASESSGNVWGFRRFLSHAAARQCVPVVGVYIGWPGAAVKNDQFLTFWNREPVADNAGNGDLTDVLRAILRAAKGDDYNGADHSTAIVIGHSFGGIALEHAATRLLREQIESSKQTVAAPADLFVLLNEAGAAAIARPFLLELKAKGIVYEDSHGRPHPLLLSMTSKGDVATKFAYPAGEFISFKRPKPVTYVNTPANPEAFHQDSSLPYDLITAANMIALQSHQIVLSQNQGCAADLPVGPIQLNRKTTYCMTPIPSALNQTPYWISQLPQIFVPDHSQVFQDYLLKLLEAIDDRSGFNGCTAPPPPLCPSPVRKVRAAAIESPRQVTDMSDRPRLRRTRE